MDEVAALDHRIRCLIEESDIDDVDDDRFEPLALDLFAYQYERCEPYRRLCDSEGRSPTTVTTWTEVPPVPSVAFKEALLTTCTEPTWRLQTSGTSTGGTRPGIVVRDDAANELCEAAQARSHKEFVLPDVEAMCFLSLAPTPELLPHAGVSHCMAMLQSRHGTASSESFFGERGPDLGRFADRLEQATADGEPVAIHGATFTMVHFFDWCAEQKRSFQLPRGSRVNHGSGYKGRSRTLTPEEFVELAEEFIGVPPAHLVNVLGMTELGSQYYDDALRRQVQGLPVRPVRKVDTPWLRARVVDPATLAPTEPGEVGCLIHVDLSLRGNISFVASEDLAIALEDGFDILGRPEEAEERGCALTVDDFIRRAEGSSA